MFLKKLFDFFIFSSLFIAICAVIMTYQTGIIFQLPFSFSLAGFVFSGTVCSYNFHWFLTPPHTENPSKKLAWNISNKNLHLVLMCAGLIAAAFFSLYLIDHWFWLMVAGIVTFLYSAPKIPHPYFAKLKKIAIAKTIYLAFAWTLITTLLPLVMNLKILPVEHILFFINRFFFLYAICILFDYRDVEEDKNSGIKSLITYFTEKGIDKLFWASILLFLVSLFLLMDYFSPPVIIALFIPAFILSLLYYPCKKNFSDYLYYFILDGLMMLSLPLLLLIKFAR